MPNQIENTIGLLSVFWQLLVYSWRGRKISASARAISAKQKPIKGERRNAGTLIWIKKERAFMKKDLVLTVDEYLDQRCVAAKHVNPPAPEARHLSITAGDNSDSGVAEHGCQCDQWGHPCPGCLEHKVQVRSALPDSTSAR
jgi:hypothetical protein